MSQLTDLHGAGAPLSLATVQCIIIAIVCERAPEVFAHQFKDGSAFRVSDSFCRKFLDKTMAWSIRKGTKTAQKLPANAEDQCETAFLRQVWTIKEHRIPAELVINADQTGVVYLPGSRMTWAPRGAKQVELVITFQSSVCKRVKAGGAYRRIPLQTIGNVMMKILLRNPGIIGQIRKPCVSGWKRYSSPTSLGRRLDLACVLHRGCS
ncbi:hypothetical protein K438DRAFT_2059579 [Mycena galopus ATCC 62051]|nr:hypothetical protein K438DRAFT_2059579 [Mycena galopus ATCC 62051]